MASDGPKYKQMWKKAIKDVIKDLKESKSGQAEADTNDDDQEQWLADVEATLMNDNVVEEEPSSPLLDFQEAVYEVIERVEAVKTMASFIPSRVATYETPVNLFDEVDEAPAKRSCNVIIGIDFTKSNSTQGKRTSQGQCLHDVTKGADNPYQFVIRTLGDTLSPLGGKIPVFGFGDNRTRDHSVFPLQSKGAPANFQEVLSLYTEVSPHIKLDGPTSYAAVVNKAVSISDKKNEFHLLVIVSPCQVGKWPETLDAIKAADAHKGCLNILLVGVGDGPFEEAENELGDIGCFQFVNYSKVTQKQGNPSASFAHHAFKRLVI